MFALNRHLTESMQLRIELRGLGTTRTLDHALALHHSNMKATNTKDAPNTVVPENNPHVQVNGETILAELKPGSWNVIVTTATGR